MVGLSETDRLGCSNTRAFSELNAPKGPGPSLFFCTGQRHLVLLHGQNLLFPAGVQTRMPATKGITRQDVLKVFDAEGDTLTTREVAEALDVTSEAARYHLKRMADSGDLEKKEVGANGFVWIARVAPRLDPDVAAEVDERTESDEFGSLTRD